MKKNTRIIIAVCAAIVIIAAVIFGGITIHDKSIIKNAKESLSVNDVTIELQQSDVTVTVDEVLIKNDVECTALFSNNAGSVEINASEVKKYDEQLTVSLLKPLIFNEELKLDVKISVTDTTAPEFTESIDEIEITEGEELNILDNFKAEDLSGEVSLSTTDIDNTQIGEQTVTVTATDKNNNTSKKEVKIIVAEKEDKNNNSDNSGNGGQSNGGGASRSASNSGSKPSGSSGKSSGSSPSSTSNNGSSGSSSGSGSSNQKETPAQKNVTAKEVQAQVNAYIKSKGITLDSSMTSGNASWTGEVWASQERLNNGKALRDGKSEVDYIIKMCGKDTILSMYCYFDGNDTLYILYW